MLPLFDHVPDVRSSRNFTKRCIGVKVISGYRFRGWAIFRFSVPGQKLVIFRHFFRTFANSSYSFDRKAIKTHRNVLCGHTQKLQEAEFWIFALKVRYWPSKVKLWNRHLTALMTSDHDHISMVGRYGQGQHNPMTSRSQGQSQGHQGRFRFWPILRIFANSSYSSHRRGLEMHRNVPFGHAKKLNVAEFEIFALKVRYCPYKVKHQNRHLTHRLSLRWLAGCSLVYRQKL